MSPPDDVVPDDEPDDDVLEEVFEYFTESGDDDSPTSDADAPAP